ncbi:plasmid pRiA4b ORF-3 family protein (plasmid) [Arthrobacter sp. FW305-123]|nr:plasmid pRiA4b ORF-3 family protein [Arthrobacter sp. FW305-123]
MFGVAVLLHELGDFLQELKTLRLARLIDGARRGPWEDSGGFPGYEETMDALAAGSDAPFDPAFLDIPAVNRALAEQF